VGGDLGMVLAEIAAEIYEREHVKMLRPVIGAVTKSFSA